MAGPVYRMFGNRAVYLEADIVAWCDGRLRPGRSAAARTAAAANKAKELMDEHEISDDELEFGVSDVEEDDFGTEDALRESAAGIIASKNVLENFEGVAHVHGR